MIRDPRGFVNFLYGLLLGQRHSAALDQHDDPGRYGSC